MEAQGEEAFFILAIAASFSRPIDAYPVDKVHVSHSDQRLAGGKTNPKARGADPRRFAEPRFLKELEDQGVIAQLYRQ